MVDVKSEKKEQLTVKQFGELSCRCIWSAHANSILAFFIGGGAVYLSLHLLKPIVYVRPEVKLFTTIGSSVCIGIYTAKVLRERCDRRITDQYDTVNLIR